MKNSVIKYYMLLLLIVICSSCEDDFLEKPPLGLFDEGKVWSDPVLIEQFVNDIYAGIPSGWNWSPGFGIVGRYHLAGATDDAEVGYTWASSHVFNDGAITTASAPFERQWTDLYLNIRKANVFFEQIADFETTPDNEEMIQRMTGEAHFLRALSYFRLVRLYGGVPIVTTPQQLDDDLLLPRASRTETLNLIIDDLESAFSLLPGEYTNTANIGRATRYAARALQARAYLYDESWEKAAAAAKEVIDNGGYTLFPDYETLFHEENEYNSEVIFDIGYDAFAAVEERGIYINRLNNPDSYDNGWGGTTPSQNLVDAYEMSNGLSIDDPGSGYDPNNPYVNRDPRFYATVNHDGTMWRGRPMVIRHGGVDGIGSHPTDATKTGYYLRKHMDEDHADIKDTNAGPNWIELRLAEILLIYAEAQNEAVGPDASVYDAVNQVRARPSVSMPPLTAGKSQDEMRDAIRHERRIELTFEDHRFFDVRRWGIAEQVLNGELRGVRIGPNGEFSGVSDDGQFTFGEFVHETRLYNPRHKYLPIPQAEIDKNPRLEQNPGY